MADRKKVFLLKASYGHGGILCPTMKDLLYAIRNELDCEDHLDNLVAEEQYLSIHVAAMTQKQIDNAPEFGGW